LTSLIIDLEWESSYEHETLEKMSSYALMFPKTALFNLGARPVIYGLSDDPRLPSGDGGGERMIDEAILPQKEQYRYVTYSPTTKRVIDWTHEREWRWPFRGKMPDFAKEWPPNPSDIPGLELASPHCHGIGAVVKSRRQAELLTVDILTLVDRGVAPPDHFSHILVLEDLPDLKALRDPEAVNNAIQAALLTLKSYFPTSEQACEAIRAEVAGFATYIEEAAPEPRTGEPGGCWLYLTDNLNPLTRALVALNAVDVTKSGRYLYRLDQFFDGYRGLRERQEMTLLLAKQVQDRFNLVCTDYAVLGSLDPDGVPTYSAGDFETYSSYNYAHKSEDF
jgi:hypothetical protein